MATKASPSQDDFNEQTMSLMASARAFVALIEAKEAEKPISNCPSPGERAAYDFNRG